MAVEVIDLLWGRKAQASWTGSLGSLVMILGCPLWLASNWIGMEYFEGSITAELASLVDHGFFPFLQMYFPRYNLQATLGFFGFVLLQAAFLLYLPGPISTGQLTPAGNLLKYKTNGMAAWALTNALFLGAGLAGVIDLAIIANHFEGVFYITNMCGYLFAAFCLVKAYVAPSHPNDCKFSGSIIFDYFVGIELNPRIGEWFDLKLFVIGRLGMLAWTLIDISYTAVQYQRLGRITNSMLIVDLFHFVYVVDYFYNESWYLRTIDICHDHCGYYLGWGSLATITNVYTIQTQYLARYPRDMTLYETLVLLSLGLGGYVIFRAANNEKDRARSTNGRCNIWGKKAEYIRCSYKTEDGSTNESLLLTSGWWGFSRHANYLGDLMQAFAIGAACGSFHFIPWAYTILLFSILLHRVPRDEARCSRKYGKIWSTYCEKVPWRMLPGVM